MSKDSKKVNIPDKTDPNRTPSGMFKPGNKIGKTGGRPKGRKSFPDLLRRIGDEEIETAEGLTTKMEILCHKLYEMAVKGDKRAIQLIAEYTAGKPAQTVFMNKADWPLWDGEQDPQEYLNEWLTAGQRQD